MVTADISDALEKPNYLNQFHSHMELGLGVVTKKPLASFNGVELFTEQIARSSSNEGRKPSRRVFVNFEARLNGTYLPLRETAFTALYSIVASHEHGLPTPASLAFGWGADFKPSHQLSLRVQVSKINRAAREIGEQNIIQTVPSWGYSVNQSSDRIDWTSSASNAKMPRPLVNYLLGSQRIVSHLVPNGDVMLWPQHRSEPRTGSDVQVHWPSYVQGNAPMRIGMFDLNLADLTVHVPSIGEKANLTPGEYSMFETLARFPNCAVSFKELEQFGNERFPESFPLDKAAMRVYVNRLRKKIEPEPKDPHFIVSHLNFGYELQVPLPINRWNVSEL